MTPRNKVKPQVVQMSPAPKCTNPCHLESEMTPDTNPKEKSAEWVLHVMHAVWNPPQLMAMITFALKKVTVLG
jgi:hypothetical protein